PDGLAHDAGVGVAVPLPLLFRLVSDHLVDDPKGPRPGRVARPDGAAAVPGLRGDRGHAGALAGAQPPHRRQPPARLREPRGPDQPQGARPVGEGPSLPMLCVMAQGAGIKASAPAYRPLTTEAE